jgi:hypothetical protein
MSINIGFPQNYSTDNIRSINDRLSSNSFSCEGFNETMQKIGDFTKGFFQGILPGCCYGLLISVAALSISFIIGVGFSAGAERSSEIFNRILGRT